MSFQQEFTLPPINRVASKDQARDIAIDWQAWVATQDLSYGEVVFYGNYFNELATRYKLAREFKREGIL